MSMAMCSIAIQWLWPNVMNCLHVAASAYPRTCMWGALCDLRMAPPLLLLARA